MGGYQVCVQRRDLEFARNIIATHDYEPHVRRAVRKRIGAGDVVVDVGANVGCIALLAATLVGDEGMVVAVEPNPDNLQMLSDDRSPGVLAAPQSGDDRRRPATEPPAALRPRHRA